MEATELTSIPEGEGHSITNTHEFNTQYGVTHIWEQPFVYFASFPTVALLVQLPLCIVNSLQLSL